MHFHDNKLSTLTGEARTYAYPGIPRKYREVYLHLMADLGCVVDFDLGCSTVCLIQLGLMGIWQKRLGKVGGTPKSKSTQPRSPSIWDTLYYDNPSLQTVSEALREANMAAWQGKAINNL